MLYYLTAAGLVLVTFFWGAGLAWLTIPRRWLSSWPLLALPLGLSLQSAVVWAAGWLPLAGTDAYGRATLVLPVFLLAMAAWQRPSGRRISGGTGAALLLTLLVALLVVSPWARRGGELTTIANGSCDAADYAAGARVLREFRPDDRSGFIGQRDVAGILQVDNFFAHWRQLNHFTPAALLALDGTLLDRRVHELAGLLGTVLIATLVPVTFLVARSVVRLPRRAALGVAALVGLGGIHGYAVYQVALGQMLCAAAVGVLTWAGYQLLRSATRERAWSFAPVIGLAWWLLLGSYAFFLVVSLAPLSGAIAWALWRRDRLARVGRTLAVAATAVAAASGFGWERLAGFALRWRLHDAVEYGWPIPRLRPDGWLGLVGSAELHPVAVAWGGVLAVALVAAFSWGWRRRLGHDRLAAWTIAGLVIPAVCGYGILSVKGAVPGSNASYDAYKLLACFQPVLLAGFLCWWRELRGVVAVTIPVAVVALVWGSAAPLRDRAASRPLVVTRDLAALNALEANPAVHSVNVLCGEMWPRLWANAFLLRKEQFFAVPTYEGRRPTALRGEWNLDDSLLRVESATATDQIVIGGNFQLTRTGTLPVRAKFGEGWYPEEHAGALRWRWSDGNGAIEIENTGSASVAVDLVVRVAGWRPGSLELVWIDQELNREIPDASIQTVRWQNLRLPPGRMALRLLSREAAPPGKGDNRTLGAALSGFELRLGSPL